MHIRIRCLRIRCLQPAVRATFSVKAQKNPILPIMCQVLPLESLCMSMPRSKGTDDMSRQNRTQAQGNTSNIYENALALSSEFLKNECFAVTSVYPVWV